jgi:hypothetical protein
MDELRQLAAKGVNGELICVTRGFEVHVFLQAGRVAWATDSSHPFAFASHLQQAASIDIDTFRQLVEDCRREHLPLGETLVNWGLASWEAVRESLLHQIKNAIVLLASPTPARTLFLERSYADYSEQLTFALDDVLVDTSSTPTPLAESTAPPPALSDRPGLARQLREAIEGLARVAVLEGSRTVEDDPESGRAWVPTGLLDATLLDGADFVAVRSPRGSIIGLDISRGERSLWCQLDADSTFGAIVSALWSMTVSSDTPVGRPPPRDEAVAWSTGTHVPTVCAEVESFMERAHELLAVLVLPCDGSSGFGCGSTGVAPERCLDIARRRARGLPHWHVPGPDRGVDRLDSIGFYLRTIVTGEASLWCFGAELGQGGESLWLFTDRRSSQGLGWAYLSSITRTLAGAQARSA